MVCSRRSAPPSRPPSPAKPATYRSSTRPGSRLSPRFGRGDAVCRAGPTLCGSLFPPSQSSTVRPMERNGPFAAYGSSRSALSGSVRSGRRRARTPKDHNSVSSLLCSLVSSHAKRQIGELIAPRIGLRFCATDPRDAPAQAGPSTTTDHRQRSPSEYVPGRIFFDPAYLQGVVAALLHHRRVAARLQCPAAARPGAVSQSSRAQGQCGLRSAGESPPRRGDWCRSVVGRGMAGTGQAPGFGCGSRARPRHEQEADGPWIEDGVRQTA
jgi:hypothetical protein